MVYEEMIMKYIGKPCVHCGKTFTFDDDIVVCPDCGSPHHRQCYKELNKCANTELHSEDFTWKPAAEKSNEAESDSKAMPEGMTKCDTCGMPIPEDEEICPYCGESNEDQIQNRRLSNEHDRDFRRIFGIDANSDMGGVKAIDLIVFVRVNVLYYASYFKLMAFSKRRLSMNILCLFFPSIYFANRRMWLWAVISAIISVLLTIPYAISMLVEMSANPAGERIFSERVLNILVENSDSINTIISICNGLDFFVRLLFCLFANLLYYRFAIHSVKKIRGRTDAEMSHTEIARAGGVRLVNTPLIILVSTAMTMMAIYGTVLALENFL